MDNNLEKMALECKEVEKNFINSLKDAKKPGELPENFGINHDKYFPLIKEIKLALHKEDMPIINDPDARKLVEQIALNKPSQLQEVIWDFHKLLASKNAYTEEVIEETRKFIFGERDENESENMLYENIGIVEDYLERRYDSGVLILGLSEIPPHLQTYFKEARDCYCLGLNIAMTIMCRTILHICLNDINHNKVCKKNISKKVSRKKTAMFLGDLIKNIIDDKELEKRARDLKNTGDKCAHPSAYTKPILPNYSRQFFQETISVVTLIYSKYGNDER